MSSILLRIKPPLILFECPLGLGHLAPSIGYGCKFDGRMKCFKVPFMPAVLVRIKEVFPNAIISEGQKFIDEMKLTLMNIHTGKSVMNTMTKDTLRISDFGYNFKNIIPRQYQVPGLQYLKMFNGAAMFADCGSGKTYMSLWDIDIKIKNKTIKPSTTLIVGKLMTMFSGWEESVNEFEDLTCKVLWGKAKSKIMYGEVENVCDHGEKPEGKSKSFSKTEYYFKSGKLAVLSGPKQFNPEEHVAKHRKWRQVGDVKYGKETLTPFSRINIRAENIRKSIRTYDDNIHIINHEGLLNFEEELTARNYDMIIIDESTAIKNPKSKVFQSLINISENTKYKRILSGTPSPQGPQDLWSQFYFLDKGLTLGSDYKCFLKEHFQCITLGSGSTYAGVKIQLYPENCAFRKGTISSINDKLKNRIFRLKLRECVDLPKLTSTVLDVFLEPQQQKHYESMKKDLFIEIEEGEKVSVNIDLAKIGKLRQITSGFILNKEKEVKEVCKKNPKLEVLDSLIEEINVEEKIIIFAIYRCEIEMLLKKYGKAALSIYGGVSDVKKFEAQDRFRNDPSIKFLICQPRSAAYGIDGLQKVSRYLIFYSIDFSADILYQAIKRIERSGQLRAMFVYYLLAKNTIDRSIYSCVQQKTRVQDQTISYDILQQIKKGA